MILKKEFIANEKIECFINNSEKAIVKVGMKTTEIDLSGVKQIELSTNLDLFSNYLLKINRVLIDLKSSNEEIKKSDVRIIVNNKEFVDFMKPDGKLMEKTSKSLKKSIDNIEFKRTLGISLYELSTFEKIDLIFKNFPQKEEHEMNNTENNQENSNFDLNMDISSFNDIINVSEIDSLNYNEDDLFKEFDLDTSDLFNDNSSSDFIFTEDEKKPKEENSFSYQTFNDDKIQESIKADIPKDDFELDLSFEDFTSQDISLSETGISKDLDAPIKNEDDISDNFTFNDNFLDDFPIEESLDFITNDNQKDDFYKTEEFNNEDEYTIKESSPAHITTNELQNDDILENEYSTDFINIEEESSIQSVKTEESEISLDFSKALNENTDLEMYTDKIDDSNNSFNNTIAKEVLPVDDSNILQPENESKVKEAQRMNTNLHNENASSNTSDNYNSKSKCFIEKELIDLKNILINKTELYKSKSESLNAKYEEKHLALKDLSLNNEKQQLEVFKEFLECKSTLISLNNLNDTCNSIINDIENKIINIKK